MKIWERHGFIVVPFVVVRALVHRGMEAIRLAYWRSAFRWEIGRNVRVHWTTHIDRKIRVRLGDGAVIGCRTQVFADFPGGIFELGANTNIAQDCSLDVSGELRIGSNATVSEGVVIYTHSHGRNPKSEPTYHAVSIGDDVWICTRALVLSSTRTIGARAIIGPYEVIRTPVPADSVVVRRTEHGIQAGPSKSGSE